MLSHQLLLGGFCCPSRRGCTTRCFVLFFLCFFFLLPLHSDIAGLHVVHRACSNGWRAILLAALSTCALPLRVCVIGIGASKIKCSNQLPSHSICDRGCVVYLKEKPHRLSFHDAAAHVIMMQLKDGLSLLCMFSSLSTCLSVSL